MGERDIMTGRGGLRTPFGALLLATAVLSACDSAEERAETHFRSALELIAADDPRRATVEFQNVFKLDPDHAAARLAFAGMLEAEGTPNDAYRQYLRLVEDTPGNLDGLRALARIAAEQGNWPEVERHLAAALPLAAKTPEGGFDPAAEPILAATAVGAEYAAAIAGDDAAARSAAADRARGLLATQPDALLLYRVVINDLLRAEDYDAAARMIDAGLAQAPRDREFYAMRLAALSAENDPEGVEAHLVEMAEVFPDDPETAATLLRWYLSRRAFDKAEAFLRAAVAQAGGEPVAAAAADAAADAAEDAAAPAGDPKTAAQVTLVRFLAEVRGSAAALAEIDLILGPADGDGVAVLRALRAGLVHDAGDPAAAIAELEAVLAEAELAEAEPSDEIRTIKVGLAQMLAGQGDRDGARARVEEVLAEDAGHIAATKLKARWLIEEDAPGDAIALLRQARDLAPRDAQLMTLLAAAHERNGDRDLMSEMLALAVETSNRAPAESLRYAAHLMATDRLAPAETVLIEALRMAPADPGLLARIGEIYVRQRDWPRTTAVADRLDELAAANAGLPDQSGTLTGEQIGALTDNTAGDPVGDPVGDPAENPIETRAAARTGAARLAGQALRAAVLQGQQSGDAVLGYLDGLIADDGTAAGAADTGAAGGAGLAPQIARLRLQLGNGEVVAAREAATDLLAQNPEDPTLRFVEASVRGVTGDAEGAKIVFRDLLAADATRLPVWMALFQITAATEGGPAAEAVLTEALAALPDAPDLLWTKATALETAGDLEGAIALYERLYAAQSGNMVFANNLASLLLTARDDPASLERAFVVARRLRDTTVPAFQDTYGWLLHRRGDSEGALPYLEAAAPALAGDAQAQYHLGAAYQAQGRSAEARAQYDKALALVPPDDARAFVAIARTEAARLAGAAAGQGAEVPAVSSGGLADD